MCISQEQRLEDVSERKISQYYKPEFNRTREPQTILLMITNDDYDQKQHYLFVKNLNSLLKRKYACSESYSLNCLRTFRTKLKLKQHENIC